MGKISPACKAAAKRKFKVWPSAYASGWGVRCTKAGGPGKKPKGSGRRLYTDENPKDTVSIKFATPADARATCAKVKRISKPYARKIQILTVVEQRSKVAGKREQARIAKRCKLALKRKHGKT